MPVPFGFRNRLLAALTAALLSLSGAAQAEEPAKTLLHVAFDRRPIGPYDADALRQDWLAGLEEMKRVALHGDLSLPVRADETLGHELVLHALHNAGHLG